MRGLSLALLLLATPLAQPLSVLWSQVSLAQVALAQAAQAQAAQAQAAQAQDDLTGREAFDIAKDVGTAEAWQAFLKRFPDGFYADIARAQLKKLAAETGGSPPPASSVEAPAPAATTPPTPATAPPAASDGAPRGKPDIALGAHADLKGVRLLPDDSAWHQDVSRAPVDRLSARILARIGNKPLHPDFGPVWDGAPIGIPYVVVTGTQKRVPVAFEDAEESDPGHYPIPADAPIEGGPKGDGDRHVLVLDRDNWVLYEVFNAHAQRDGSWKGGSGAIWDLTTNQVRPDRWTSADAAGLPIMPGLIRYDEVVGTGAVGHALRFTLAKTRRAYVPPASHWASDADDETLPPMGMRVRLKAGYDTSGFDPQVQAILQALKTYGMILADNGSDNFVSGGHDPRWDPDVLRQLKRVTTKDLEVVEMNGLVAGQSK